MILVASDPAEESNVYEQITTGSRWADISAVKTGRVYQIPRGLGLVRSSGVDKSAS